MLFSSSVEINLFLFQLTYSSKHDPSRQKQARIVFDVKQEGKARKLITIRSALIVRNELDSSIDLKMATDLGLEGIGFCDHVQFSQEFENYSVLLDFCN